MFTDVLKDALAYVLRFLVLALIAYGCAIAKTAFYKYFDTEEKRKIARTVVHSVEQMFKKIHGEEKLNEALKLAEQLCAAAKIPFDAAEMRVLIESFLGEMNKVFEDGDGNKNLEEPSEGSEEPTP